MSKPQNNKEITNLFMQLSTTYASIIKINQNKKIQDKNIDSFTASHIKCLLKKHEDTINKKITNT